MSWTDRQFEHWTEYENFPDYVSIIGGSRSISNEELAAFKQWQQERRKEQRRRRRAGLPRVSASWDAWCHAPENTWTHQESEG